MNLPFAKCLQAAVQGGSVAGIAAPLMWPLVLLFNPPPNSDGSLGLIVEGLLLIALVALTTGIALGIVVGFPSLLLLAVLRLTHPLVVAFVGALLAQPVVFGFFSWPRPSMSLTLFASILGGLCGWVAGKQLRLSTNAL